MDVIALDEMVNPEGIFRHIDWNPGVLDIAEVCKSYDLDLPQVVKIDGGDYGNFGIGTNVDVQKPFLLYTSRSCCKVLAASIQWDEEQQEYTEVGQRLVIPLNYPGWFHFLQDSGKSGQTWTTVEEVAKGRPEVFLTSTTTPCYMYSQQERSGERFYMKEDIQPGQMLYASDVYTETITSKKPTCCFNWLSGRTMKEITREINYLQATDSNGREVLLEFTQKGEYYGVGEAGTAFKNSVYCLGDIVKYVDLPVNTKLTFGEPPSTPCSFTGMLKFEELYYEETIIACSLGGGKNVMVEFPTDSEIKFILARNNAEVLDSILLQEALCHCTNNINAYVNSIKVVQNFYPENVKSEKSIADRCLPPVPGGGDTASMNTAITDDFTDDEESEIAEVENHQVTVDINPVVKSVNPQKAKQTGDVNGNVTKRIKPEWAESHYEEIPGNSKRKEEEEDEQGYLVPIHAYSQIGIDNPIMPRSASAKDKRPYDENGYLKQVRSNQLPDDVTEIIDKHVKERLDKYLIDSVQEFHRVQLQNEYDMATKYTQSDTSPQTKEDMEKYLETLFDCDKMTQEPISTTPKPRFKRLNSMPGIWDFQAGAIQDNELLRRPRRRNSTTADTMPLPAGYRTPMRFSLNNPDATLRRHNLEQVMKPVPRPMGFNDDTGFEIPAKYGFEARRAATPENTLHSDNFVPIDRPSSLHGANANEILHPDDVGHFLAGNQGSDNGPRTDSGIFITCPVWSDPYAIDSDSPYRTGSEGSSWTPPSDLSNASVQEVAQSLRYIGMRDLVVKLFFDEQIDGKQLLDLNDHLLTEGFPQLNALDRKKIVDFIGGWRPKRM